MACWAYLYTARVAALSVRIHRYFLQPQVADNNQLFALFVYSISNMKKITNYIISNYAVILFAVVLFFPLFFAFDADNADLPKRLWTNIAYTLITITVLLVCQDKIRKVLAIILALVSYAPNMIVLSFLIMDNYILKSTDFWVVFNSNPTEAANLFATLSASVYVWCTIYTLLLIFSLVILERAKSKRTMPYYIQMIALIVLLSVSAILPFRAKVPMIDFYKSCYKYQREMRDVAEFYARRQNIQLDVTCSLPDGKKTFIIVIGESQNRLHMQLYGYTRETNPLLSEIADELICYKDVCSPATQTLASLKQVLSFSNYEHPELYKQEANIIEIVRSAGYKTFWIDNQGKSGNGAFAIDTYTPTSYRTMAKQSNFYDDNKSAARDSSLTPQLEQALNDSATNKVIFLHLMGNHFDYKERYEQSFNVFTSTEGMNTPYLASLKQNQIDNVNAYDNATLYNDYIIRTFIEMLRKQEGISALLYFSDHGEEVYDYQLYMTRSFEMLSPAMCDIPLILWQNDNYRRSSTLSLNADVPTCTDDIIYGIMDLTGARYKLYEPEKSIFSPLYTPKERKVQGISYQSIRDNFSNIH